MDSGCFFFLCFDKSPFQDTLWLHCSHWNFKPSCTDCLCNNMFDFCAVLYLHWSQLILISLCLLSLWFESEPLLLKLLRHLSHWNGFSEVCVILCDFKCRWERNFFSQMLHLKSFALTVWTVMCFLRLSTVANILLQTSHFSFLGNKGFGCVLFSCFFSLCFSRLLGWTVSWQI